LLGVLMTSVHPASAYDPAPAHFLTPEPSSTQPYLGIDTYFGRWDGPVPIAYNHTGARDDVSAARMIQLLQEAIQIIEHVADIKFDFQGETASHPNNHTDNLVV